MERHLRARERGDDQEKHGGAPWRDTSGQEKGGMTKRNMAAHCGETPQYQGTESRHGPQSCNGPSQMENPCCRLTCQTAKSE